MAIYFWDWNHLGSTCSPVCSWSSVDCPLLSGWVYFMEEGLLDALQFVYRTKDWVRQSVQITSFTQVPEAWRTGVLLYSMLKICPLNVTSIFKGNNGIWCRQLFWGTWSTEILFCQAPLWQVYAYVIFMFNTTNFHTGLFLPTRTKCLFNLTQKWLGLCLTPSTLMLHLKVLWG